jgi:two-component system, chemotaxis family, protein-glutamate methylesterase/glutaminase
MKAGRRTRILIVDDSAVFRNLLRSVVTREPVFEVVATAPDGAAALACLESARPDLILLDVEMPVMDGLVTLRELRARGYTLPVIMCSSLTQRGAHITLEALARGASDYVAKPLAQSSREETVEALAADMLPKIHALTRAAQAQSASPAPRSPLPFAPPAHFAASPQSPESTPSVVVIGVSTGGPAALEAVLPLLPANFPLPILVVQHMPEVFTRLLAERLDSTCLVRVAEADEGAPVAAGTVSIARGNWHLEVVRTVGPGAHASLHLTQAAEENHCRPAADVLFRSAARVYGPGVLAVVLTGMGADALDGCRVIRDHGGSVLAQDEASSTVWGMPGAVANAGLAHRILPLGVIAAEILRFASRANASRQDQEIRRMVHEIRGMGR